MQLVHPKGRRCIIALFCFPLASNSDLLTSPSLLLSGFFLPPRRLGSFCLFLLSLSHLPLLPAQTLCSTTLRSLILAPLPRHLGHDRQNQGYRHAGPETHAELKMEAEVALPVSILLVYVSALFAGIGGS